MDLEGLKNKKIAIVHDFLVSFGGAERVLEVLHEMFPEAPIYTLLHDKEKMRGKLEKAKIETSFLQKFPKFLRKRYRWMAPFMSVAIESLDLREYDLVISSSSAWSKGIVTRLSTKHVAYIHSPMRFAWDYSEKYLEESGQKGIFTRLLLTYLRIWDKQASERPDYLISNSRFTQKRVEKYYRRESEIIYPPILDYPKENFSENKKEFFITVSRLSKYKQIDKIIEAFNELGLSLIVVGEGREKDNLKKIAGENVEIVGWKSDQDLLKLYSRARGFIFASFDDFGLAPVEAMAHGIPVFAFRGGGALEYVEEGKTGNFFDSQEKEPIKKAVQKFLDNEKQYDREYIKQKSEKFSKENFKREFQEFLEKNISNSTN